MCVLVCCSWQALSVRAWRGKARGAVLSYYILSAMLWNWTGQKDRKRKTERERQAGLTYSLPVCLSILPLTTYQGHHFPPGDRPVWGSDWLGATMHLQRLLWLQVSWLTKQSRGIDILQTTQHVLLLLLLLLLPLVLLFLLLLLQHQIVHQSLFVSLPGLEFLCYFKLCWSEQFLEQI